MLAVVVGSVVTLGLSSALAPAVLARGSAQPASPALTCDGAWHVEPSDDPSSTNKLGGVTAVSPSLAWAVGQQRNFNPQHRYRTLIERWDGSAWASVPSPDMGKMDGRLSDVAAPDPTDAFAVGIRHSRGPAKTLIERFDGTSWSLSPSPNRGSGNNFLSSIAALGSDDAWAVGFHELTTGRASLVEHWNGAAWSVVRSPNHHSFQTSLSDVDAVSSTDVWAVGSYFGRSNRGDQPLAEHWNGTTWSVVRVASPGPENSLSSVAALAADDVWAVGYSDRGYGPFAEHWDGSAWSIVPVAIPGPLSAFLGVATAGSSVYAVGVRYRGPYKTLAELWDGTSFQVVSTPNEGPAQRENTLNRAASDGATVWAVGAHQNRHGRYNTLVEYVC